MVLFEVKWLHRGTTAFQERYSGDLCGIFFHTIVLEYDMRLAMPSSRFGGMKMLPWAVGSSTHLALVVIYIWALW